MLDFYELLFQRIPLFRNVAIHKQPKQQQIMGNHAGPGGNQSKAKQLGTDKCTHNPHTPHAQNVEHKGLPGIAHAKHHALDDDGEAVEGL